MVGNPIAEYRYLILVLLFPFLFLAGGRVQWQRADLSAYRENVARAIFCNELIHTTRIYESLLLNLGDGIGRTIDVVVVESNANIHYLTNGGEHHVFKLAMVPNEGFTLASGPIAYNVA